jgi:undecaprenyl-diphosphatase
MTIIQSLILGIIEGFTEFLPISSTAHLLIAGELLKIPDGEFLKTYSISIQFGAILSVVVLYWRKIWNNVDLIWKLMAAFIPTAIIGLLCYPLVKNYFMESLSLIAISLILGGLAIFWFERRKNNPDDNSISDLKNISYKQSIILGFIQTLAMIPGVSRSAATIIGGLAQGINRKTIVEFSFLLAIPTMLAATVYDAYKNIELISGDRLDIWLIGLITSFITAIIGIKFLIKYIQKNNFNAFAWYRIFVGSIILLVLFI